MFPYIDYASKAKVIFYVPDTLDKLIRRIKESQQEDYLLLLEKLISHWYWRGVIPKYELMKLRETPKTLIDTYLELISEERIYLIRKKLVDKNLYNFCYQNFIDNELFIKLSPKINLFGDVVGKILGGSLKLKRYIIAHSKGLIWIVSDKMTTLRITPKDIGCALDHIIEMKRNVFKISHLKERPGGQFLFWIMNFFPVVNKVLAVVDP